MFDFGVNEDLQALYKAQDEAEEIVPCTNDPDLFFPDQGGHGVQWTVVKKLCGGCPIVAQCAEYGIKHEPYFGVWGGLSIYERAVLAGRRRSA